VKKIALAALLAFTLLPAASFAQVVIRVGPPAPVYERPGPPPERGFVWIDGYQSWAGDHYVWVPGR
jgi:opacity protein-like surface antigen